MSVPRSVVVIGSSGCPRCAFGTVERRPLMQAALRCRGRAVAPPRQWALRLPLRCLSTTGERFHSREFTGVARAVRHAPPKVDGRRAASTASARLQSARVALRKRLGQHVLKGVDVSRRIVKAADVTPGMHVMEVGPGTGNLTVPLLQSGARVTAYELDERMHYVVRARAHQLGLHDHFECHRIDVLAADLPAFDVCVANIPFQISSPLLRKLLAHRPQFQHAVIMLQKEFADRLVATPGSKPYSRLSVGTQVLARVERCFEVPRTAFRPPPKVDCTIVKVTPLAPPEGLHMAEWEALLRMAFHSKNKMLRSIFKLRSTQTALRRANDDDGDRVLDTVQGILADLSLSTARPNGLPVEQFVHLHQVLREAGISLTPQD